LARHMDITCDAYIQMFAGLRVWQRSRLDLYLFADNSDYMRTLRTAFNVDGTGSWGMCISRDASTSIVGWRGDRPVHAMKTLLQHEGFHQFSRTLFPELPVWAEEGLAEIFERGVVVADALVLGEVPSRDRSQVVDAIENGKFRTCAALFTMRSEDWLSEVKSGDASGNYLQAWSLVHFFLYADDARYQRQFLTFLANLNRGAQWEPSFVAAFGMPDFRVMEQKWLDYCRQWSPTDYRETISRLEFLAMGLEALRERGEFPSSIDALKKQLSAIDFAHSSSLHGESREMKASDSRLFEVPYANSGQSSARFTLVDQRGRELKNQDDARKEASESRRAPPFPMIVTAGLEPRNLLAKWVRVNRGKYQCVFAAE